MKNRGIPVETIIELQQRLTNIPPRSSQRRKIIQEIATLYGVSEHTIYRILREKNQLQENHRADRNIPRVMSKISLERYCEVIAALKIRTCNGKGRHLSTVQAIRLLEEHGIDTPDGHLQAPVGLLKKTTVNRYLKQWGLTTEKLSRQPPAVRFQADYSNQCWHFDLSPSDLKYLKNPSWIDESRGQPLLMLYSIVDDRSGVSYQEYHSVYGEDVGAALKFLFNAMSPKTETDFLLQGIPQMIYMDNGPIGRSLIFQKVMGYLGVEVKTHMSAGKDGRRVTARSKGKVERPFRTVKEMHETLYHLHEPETEAEANAWLMRFLLHYNSQSHRHNNHSRMEDWLKNLPSEGIRQMCSWERFCTFAREPERRKVSIDACVSVDGVNYSVSPDLAGEKVILWWGLFDHELYVEHEEQKYGPYSPIGAPIPLHRYRRFKKTRSQKKADQIENLAKQLNLPVTALGIVELPQNDSKIIEFPRQSFIDPDPFGELMFPNVITAKKAIADYLGKPLAKLTPEQMGEIDGILDHTLKKKEVMKQIKEYFDLFSGR